MSFDLNIRFVELHIAKLELRIGDTLVVQCPSNVPDKDASALHDFLQGFLPKGCAMVLLHGPYQVKLSVMRPMREGDL